MSETSTRLTIKEANDSNEVVSTKDDLYEDTFTIKNNGEFTLIGNSTYKTIDLGNVTTAKTFKLDSDYQLKMKINGGATEIVTDSIFFRGEITSVEVRNITSSTAKIKYEVYQ